MSTQLLRKPQRWFGLSIFLLSLVASGVQAVTNFVTNFGDSGPGSLRQAIVDCNNSGGGTVVFSNVSGSIFLVTNLPVVTADLRLIGPGTNSLSITSSNKWNLQFDAGSTNEILAITVENGTIYNLGSLRMADCIFKSARQYGYGPLGIYNAGELTVANTVFSRCRNLSGDGGALLTRGIAWVSNSVFSSNIGGDDYEGGLGMGGAILVTDGVLSVMKCSFDGNQAIGQNANISGGVGYRATGGAIHINKGIVAVSESSFQSNSVTGGDGGDATGPAGLAGASYGGAVYVCTGRVDLIKCTFDRNVVNGATGGTSIRGNGITPPPGEAAGGALAIFGGNTTVANSTFSFNVVYGGLGGASYSTTAFFPANGGGAFGGAIVVDGGSLSINNCTISGNKAVGHAGGAVFDYGIGAVRYGANGSGYGGAISAVGGSCPTVSSIVAGNLGVYAGTNMPYATDGYGSLLSQGFNLFGTSSNLHNLTPSDLVNVDPMLGPLQDNGGPTLTHALLAGSPAIDAGTNAVGAGDQRGQPRTIDDRAVPNAPGGDGTDIGALEVNPVLSGTGVVVGGSNVLVRFTSVSDRSYRLQYKDRLQDAWSVVAGPVPGTGGIATLTNISVGNLPSRFYRVYSTGP